MAPKVKRRVTAAKKQLAELKEEEFEKIPRPFEEIDDLPVSTNPPDYSILGNALSIKDTAVLYTALLRSRKALLNPEIFDLYWVKSLKGLELNRDPIISSEVNARDTMSKLCDCTMNIGPHIFEIRLFIVKDKRSDKKEKSKDSKDDEDTTDIKAEAGADKNTHSKEARPKIEALEEEKSSVPAMGKVATDDEKTATETSTPEPEKMKDAAAEVPKQKSLDNETGDSKILPTANLSPADSDTTIRKPAAASDTPQKSVSKENMNSDQPRATESSTVTEPAIEKAPSKTATPQRSSSSTPIQQRPAQQPQPIQRPNSTQPQPAKPANSDIMQTPENHIMIANLNAIARVDPSLNTLMKIVASGNATPEQIVEFQGYIQRAREMGPQNYMNLYRTSSPAMPKPVHVKPIKEVKPKPPKPPKPPKKPKIPKEQKLTAFQEKYLDDATICFEFMENVNVRFLLPKDAIIEILPNEEVIISFLSIHNREEVQAYENAVAAKKQKEEEEIKAEEDRLAKIREEEEKLKAAAEEAKNKSESAAKKSTAETQEAKDGENKEESAKEKQTDNEDSDVIIVKEEELPHIRPKRRAPPPPKRGKKKRNIAKQPVQEPELVEPDVKFTSVSFTLNSIPGRFSPIIENSVNKLPDVQEKMKIILSKGHRAPQYYLWYKVDSKQDEELSENLRVALHTIENPGKTKYKKRVSTANEEPNKKVKEGL